MSSIKEVEQMLLKLGSMLEEIKAEEKPKRKTTTKKENKPSITKVEEHTVNDIPDLLSKMSKTECIKRFGLLKGNPTDNPYKFVGISKFFDDYNIKLTGYQRKSFTYGNKHIIFEKQLKDENKKTVNKVKNNCVNYIQDKISNIPDKNRWGKVMTSTQKDKIENSLKSEIKRWG